MSNKLGSVNPCNMTILLDKNGSDIGRCLDTPNSFAVACMLSNKVVYGKTYYQYFPTKYHYKTDDDIQQRIKSYEKFKDTSLKEEFNKHKQFIKIY